MSGSGSISKPSYSTAEILVALQTNWGDSLQGVERGWGDNSVTFSIPDTIASGSSSEAAGFQPLTGPVWGVLKPVVEQAFQLWSEFSGLSLVEAIGGATAIVFAYSGTTKGDGTYASPTLAYGSSKVLSHQDIWFSTDPVKWGNQTPASVVNADGSVNYEAYGFQTMLHEIGHALGLSHLGTYDAGSGLPISYAADAVFAEDTRKTSIMSYFGGWNSGKSAWTTSSADTFSATPTIYDILAVQGKYGADTSTRAGDTRYGWGSDAGWTFFDFALNTKPIFAIWDAGGTDFIDASHQGSGVAVTANQLIDLSPGSYSSLLGMTDNVSIAFNVVIEGAAGGDGDDTLLGNAADNLLLGKAGYDLLFGRAGDDTLDGGAGDDTLDAGAGNNLLSGGGHGALGDRFVFRAGESGHDTVLGFDPATDQLQFHGLNYVRSLGDLFGTGDPWPSQNLSLVLDPLRGTETVLLQGVSGEQLSGRNISFEDAPPQGGAMLTIGGSYIPFSIRPTALAALTDGNLLMVHEMRGDALGLGEVTEEIDARLYAADGTLLRDLVVNQGLEGQQIAPAVAALPGGGFVVSWVSGASAGPYYPQELLDARVEARLFDAAGNPLGGDLLANADLTGFNRIAFAGLYGSLGSQTVWARADGGFGVAWSAVRQTDGATMILEREFDALGQALGLDHVLLSGGVATGAESYPGLRGFAGQTHLAATGLANGDVVLSWAASDGLHYQEIAADGSLVALGTLGNASAADLRIVQLGDGRVMASWFQDDGLYAASLGGEAMRVVTLGLSYADGAVLASPFGAQHDAAALPDGALALFWVAQGGDAAGTSLQVSVLAADGTLAAPELVNPYDLTIDRRYYADPAGGNQAEPYAVTLADGRVAVTWTDSPGFFPMVRAELLDTDLHGVATAGGDGADQLTGSAWNDTLTGLGGDDTLEGRGGPDLLDGGAGHDTASYVSSAAGVQVSLADGTASGGDAAGDTLVSIENLTGSAFDDTLLGDAGNNQLDGTWGDDLLLGGGGTDTLLGGAGNDSLTLAAGQAHGGSGNDRLEATGPGAVLFGDAGDDQLVSAGHAVMFGGTGNDLFRVAAGDVVYEFWGEGFDTIVTGQATYVLPDNVEALVLTAPGGTSGTGNALDNLLQGGDGADLLDGGLGNDTLHGGAGDDTLIGGPGNDLLDGGDGTQDVALFAYTHDAYQVSELAGGGYVVTGIGFAADQGADTILGVELLHFGDATGTPASLLAGDWADLLLGSLGDDTLEGRQGDDTLIGNGGNDLLLGGSGNDMLLGGPGDDTLDGGGGNDTVSYADAPAAVFVDLDPAGMMASGDGNDLLLNIENVIGSAFDDTLLGDAGNNLLDGNGGNDLLFGRAGDDTLRAGDGNSTLDGGDDQDLAVIDASLADVRIALEADGSWLLSWNNASALLRNIERVQFIDTTITLPAHHVANDFTGDGLADGLWQSAGTLAVFATAAGGALGGLGPVLGIGDGWTLAGRTNLDGDAAQDLVFTDLAGDLRLALFHPGAAPTLADLAPPGAGWSFWRAADLSGDGRDEILWTTPDNNLGVTSLTADGTRLADTWLGRPGDGWVPVASPDLNADGHADILWQNDALGGALGSSISNADGTGFASINWLGKPGAGWSYAGVGDFNGDGRADTAWLNADGILGVALTNATGTGLAASYWFSKPGDGWTLKDIADVNGDGRADTVWQNGALGGAMGSFITHASLASDGSPNADAIWWGLPGAGWAYRGTGDANGDGRADLLFTFTDGSNGAMLADAGGAPATANYLGNLGPEWHLD